MALAVLALCEHEFGTPLPALLASILGPLHTLRNAAAIAQWAYWHRNEDLWVQAGMMLQNK